MGAGRGAMVGSCDLPQVRVASPSWKVSLASTHVLPSSRAPPPQAGWGAGGSSGLSFPFNLSLLRPLSRGLPRWRSPSPVLLACVAAPQEGVLRPPAAPPVHGSWRPSLLLLEPSSPFRLGQVLHLTLEPSPLPPPQPSAAPGSVPSPSVSRIGREGPLLGVLSAIKTGSYQRGRSGGGGLGLR